MFRHVVMFRLSESADEAVRTQILSGLAELPALVSGIERFVFGVDAKLVTGNHDVVVVADFLAKDAYVRYATHPAHVEFVNKCIRPYLTDRAAVQCEIA